MAPDPREASSEHDPREVSELASDLFRRRAGAMVATLTRSLGLGQLDLVEDSVQEAFTRALRSWCFAGVPRRPEAWLMQVARNAAIDRLRRAGVYADKLTQLVATEASGSQAGGEPASSEVGFAAELADDQLRLIFACCHPSLGRDAQVALTLKTACGFGVGEIARAFLVTPETMRRRLSRAKLRLREGAVAFEIPAPEALDARLDAVLEVVYLLLNEGHVPHAGALAFRSDLCAEAVRLAELLSQHPRSDRPRTHALAALAHFVSARLPARRSEDAALITLDRQDRLRYRPEHMQRGVTHLAAAMGAEALSSYHLEAEIAACHTLAATWDETDWPRIIAIYEALAELRPTPVVALNRAVAHAQVHGAAAGLELLAPLADALANYPPFHAARADLLQRLGQREPARAAYSRAIELSHSQALRSFLERRRAQLPAAACDPD